jgi:hypothetical protein
MCLNKKNLKKQIKIQNFIYITKFILKKITTINRSMILKCFLYFLYKLRNKKYFL